MFKNFLFLSIFLIAVVFTGYTQEVDYSDVTFTHQTQPTLTQFSDYKSFDLTVLTTKAAQDKPGTGFNMVFQPKVGNLTQVDDGGDFHIISLLQKYAGKMTSPATAQISVALNSTIYDKHGNVIAKGTIANDYFDINFGRNLSKDEMGNADIVRKLAMEKIIEASLKPLTDGLYGAKLTPTTRLAALDDVKKKPELQEFDAQVKALKPAIEKEGLAGFKKVADAYLSYWERMSNYSGEGDKDEVKRAALQNLSLYYIAAGNAAKAKEYIEQYKPIDKQIKAMLGLVKYKNSEELGKLITTLFPATGDAAAAIAGTDKTVTKAELADAFQFITINGTATVSGKKDAGTYNGVIKVNKIPSNTFGNIVNLDPENIAVTINTKDEAGQPKTIYTTVSKLDVLKDNNGTSFTSQKFGTPMLGDGVYYIFMQSSFTSPKVTVYRAIVPATGEYVVKKAGDDKGVKSSLMNARKNLEEYLGDCPSLIEKFKTDAIDKKATVEKIAEEYSKCQ
jgi:hypothetical protein